MVCRVGLSVGERDDDGDDDDAASALRCVVGQISHCQPASRRRRRRRSRRRRPHCADRISLFVRRARNQKHRPRRTFGAIRPARS